MAICRQSPCPIDGFWLAWKEWSNCDRACGGGNRRRFRKCVEPLHGGAGCVGDAKEEEECNLSTCPPGGIWNAWSDWSACSVTCGEGGQSRARSCEGGFSGAAQSGCVGETDDKRSCNDAECPVDGRWLEWSSWSDCSAECGGGESTRRRECRQPLHGGRNCVGDTIRDKSCNEDPCPIDGSWTEWSEWMGLCTQGCGGGEESSVRSCVGPFFGGAPCVGEETKRRLCNTGKCPIDGIWEAWAPWTPCSRTCGGGKQRRNRKCHGPFYNGKECEGDKYEEDGCSPEPCPIDGVWREWSRYSECSVTCGRGAITRFRECVEPVHDGADCPGEATESRTCERKDCPMDGEWSEWEKWGSCLVTCGGGERYRGRHCVGPFHGGAPCEGVEREAGRCAEGKCPTDGEWGEWGAWRRCDCGEKVQRRYRECLGRKDGGKPCPGLHRDERDCDC